MGGVLPRVRRSNIESILACTHSRDHSPLLRIMFTLQERYPKVYERFLAPLREHPAHSTPVSICMIALYGSLSSIGFELHSPRDQIHELSELLVAWGLEVHKERYIDMWWRTVKLEQPEVHRLLVEYARGYWGSRDYVIASSGIVYALLKTEAFLRLGCVSLPQFRLSPEIRPN